MFRTFRKSALLLTIVLFALAVAAANSPIVGKWDLTSTDETGRSTKWILNVTEDQGKLSAVLIEPEGQVPLSEPKFVENKFTAKVLNGNDVYLLECSIDGKTIAGKFTGPQANGTIKGTKQP